ncbi:MAG: Gfo/Idh/MocA family oxidoreductase [Salinisphaera sp.]|jgi:predicted dehydrogenase|nr:Gfo/Idh/MocA family oxidoreductase [Salinisphaera sp.]
MRSIGIGIVGGGYMGKAHAVAMQAVAAVFETTLRPRLETICASSPASAEIYRNRYGFIRGTADWAELVNDPAVEAVVIASPQETHLEIARAALALGKPVLCEKPMGATASESAEMVALAEAAAVPAMVGYNYIRTPATQFARELLRDGVIGKAIWFRGEHTEDFFADPEEPATWRCTGRANGTMGDLAPHMINCALTMMGPISSLLAEIGTVYPQRPGPNGPVAVTNDDQAQIMCRFANGAMGHLLFSRVATGKKMGYAYEITGTKGAIRFDQEDQNALWLYQSEGPKGQRGFRKILSGPEHPDYLPFCQGPGHGTGYQDQIIIEAYHFLKAIETGTGTSPWPSFSDGLDVARVIEGAFISFNKQCWQAIAGCS